MKTVLLYGFLQFNGQLQAKMLQNSLSGTETEVRVVPASQFDAPVGSVLWQPVPSPEASQPGLPSQTEGAAAETEALPARMLVFCGFDQEELTEALGCCRSCGITRDDLKAVLTQDNIGWSGRKLCQSLLEEHIAMTGNRK